MSAAIVDQLLHASLLCGLAPAGRPAYRLQLFTVANRDLRSPNHQSDFQRAIETGVDRDHYWENAGEKGSGEYVLSELGFAEARRRVGNVKAVYEPLSKLDFRCTLEGAIGRTSVELRCRTGKWSVSLDGRPVSTAAEACRLLSSKGAGSIRTEGNSAARVLYDLGIDNGFRIEFR